MVMWLEAKNYPCCVEIRQRASLEHSKTAYVFETKGRWVKGRIIRFVSANPIPYLFTIGHESNHGHLPIYRIRLRTGRVVEVNTIEFISVKPTPKIYGVPYHGKVLS